MQRVILSLLCLLVPAALVGTRALRPHAPSPNGEFFGADDARIRITGRVDFSDPKKPKFWAPGVYVQAHFKGTFCEVVIDDEILWGKSHNYLEVVVDDRPSFRIQARGKTNTFRVADGLPDGVHTLTLCKDTEAGIGSMQFVGLRCQGLAKLPRASKRKLEFYGDSITCGTGSDLSKVACDKGQWYDQHNAYASYGPTTARLLDARWQLTAVSGIGMAHSCCDMKETMPDMWDKTDLRENKISWNFARYQPDAVMICLGQNDGSQNPEKFRETYAGFIRKLRAVYPQSDIVCLTSPMADDYLRASMKSNLTQIVDEFNRSGDKKVRTFFFSRGFNAGCGGHPDRAQHGLIAQELAGFLRTTLDW